MARFDSVDVSYASTGANAHSGIAVSNLDYFSMFGARSFAFAIGLLTGRDFILTLTVAVEAEQLV